MFSFFLVALPLSLLRIPVNMVLRLVSDVGNENEYAMRSDQKSRNRREKGIQKEEEFKQEM